MQCFSVFGQVFHLLAPMIITPIAKRFNRGLDLLLSTILAYTYTYIVTVYPGIFTAIPTYQL